MKFGDKVIINNPFEDAEDYRDFIGTIQETGKDEEGNESLLVAFGKDALLDWEEFSFEEVKLINDEELDRHYLLEAYKEANNNSTDPNTKNGAVLVNEYGTIVARGANHFPRGVKELPERWERPIKYEYVEHAERNVIFDAAKNGVQTDGLTMYACWSSCANCARAIIQAGITEVVTHKVNRPPSKTWDETIRIALGMFEEAGVKFRYYEGNLGTTILINGDIVEV